MQAIETVYLGPTNTKGSRIRAKCAANSKIYNWDHELNPEENHIAAANKLIKHLNWLDKHWMP